MFVGHLAVALGAKKVDPDVPLGAAVAAAFGAGLDLARPSVARARDRPAESGRYRVHESRLRRLSLEPQSPDSGRMVGTCRVHWTKSARLLALRHGARRACPESLGAGPRHTQTGPARMARRTADGSWTMELDSGHDSRESGPFGGGALDLSRRHRLERPHGYRSALGAGGANWRDMGQPTVGTVARVGDGRGGRSAHLVAAPAVGGLDRTAPKRREREGGTWVLIRSISESG